MISQAGAQPEQSHPTLAGRLRRLAARLDLQDGLPARQQVLIFFLCLLVLILRWPALFLHAEFYAEDGSVWYKQAYETGWLHSLTLEDGGYLNTLQRIGSGFALLVPFRWAPLTGNLFGALIQCIPVTILLSARARNWGSLSTRACFAFIYTFIPNSHEIHVVLTNCQWHLAVAQILLVFGTPPRTWRGRAVDFVILFLGSVSGPFAIVLTPLIAVFWWFRRHSWTLVQFALCALCSALQAFLVITRGHERIQGALGATPALLLKIVGGDIVWGALLGGFHWTMKLPFLLLAPAALVLFAVFFYLLRCARLEFKLLVIFTTLTFIAAMHSPLIAGPRPLWELLLPNAGGRYWYYPMLTFLWALTLIARTESSRPIRRAAIVLLCFLPLGMLADFRYKPYEDNHFPQQVEQMKQAAPGTDFKLITIPLRAETHLIKRGPVGTIDH